MTVHYSRITTCFAVKRGHNCSANQPLKSTALQLPLNTRATVKVSSKRAAIGVVVRVRWLEISPKTFSGLWVHTHNVYNFRLESHSHAT